SAVLDLVRALGSLLREPALSRAVGWDDVLQAGAESGRALARFERALGALDKRFAGPFLNGDIYGLYFRAQLHAAFERACIHYVDGLASVERSAAFVDAFRDPPPGPRPRRPRPRHWPARPAPCAAPPPPRPARWAPCRSPSRSPTARCSSPGWTTPSQSCARPGTGAMPGPGRRGPGTIA